MAGGHNQPPFKRRHRLPEIHAFSSFARYLSNASRASSSRSSLSRSKSLAAKLESDPVPDSRRIDSSPSSSSSDEVEEGEGAMETVQADFGFFDPKLGDFAGVKLLLQNYLDDKVWDLSGFVDLILAQTTVGTVVKSDSDEGGGDDEDDGGEKGEDEEEDVYAVISALNLGRYAGQQCIGELKKFLLGSCSDESIKKNLKPLLKEQASDVGLLVCQRFVNCPHQLVPPLYDGLFDEVSWATEDEPTKELRDSFRFKFYLLATRIYENKNATKHKASKQDGGEPIIYVKAEDEIFRELSLWSFTFPLHLDQLAPRELKNYRSMGLVMVLKADDVPKFRTKLKSLMAES